MGVIQFAAKYFCNFLSILRNFEKMKISEKIFLKNTTLGL